jgi:hypothetical protein
LTLRSLDEGTEYVIEIRIKPHKSATQPHVIRS